MTLADCIYYLTQLLQTCWGAFTLRIWGVPIWVYLAVVMFFALTTAFIRYVFGSWLDVTATDSPKGGK